MAYLPEKLAKRLGDQHYHLIGEHSAVKICKWTKESLLNERSCYKNTFYGIRSWRCIQCSPIVSCNFACRFCWRTAPADIGVKFDELSTPKWDSPEFLADAFIKEQIRIVSGYKGNSKTNLKRWSESQKPLHVALSLVGEITTYPFLSELIEGFHKRKMSTFLVTNGSYPEKLEKITPPTQLYISVYGPDEATYKKAARPMVKDAWKRVNETLELFPSIKTRKVIRLTLVKGLNFIEPENYAKLILKAMPDYVEPKAFMFVGGTRFDSRKLNLSDMPTHGEIREFSEKLVDETGYILSDEREDSRVVLLSRDKNAEKERFLFKNE
jgi:tRNA wybutosine-synthesizing protein 1